MLGVRRGWGGEAGEGGGDRELRAGEDGHRPGVAADRIGHRGLSEHDHVEPFRTVGTGGGDGVEVAVDVAGLELGPGPVTEHHLDLDRGRLLSSNRLEQIVRGTNGALQCRDHTDTTGTGRGQSHRLLGHRTVDAEHLDALQLTGMLGHAADGRTGADDDAGSRAARSATARRTARWRA
ncbi:MAG: hypothetical protein R2710_13555 [Acidimicrobiales bacterium]